MEYSELTIKRDIIIKDESKDESDNCVDGVVRRVDFRVAGYSQSDAFTVALPRGKYRALLALRKAMFRRIFANGEDVTGICLTKAFVPVALNITDTPQRGLSNLIQIEYHLPAQKSPYHSRVDWSVPIAAAPRYGLLTIRFVKNELNVIGDVSKLI